MNAEHGKGAIFDLDGTLLDSMHVWDKIDHDFFAGHGLGLPENYQKTITSMSYMDAAAYTKRLYGLAETVEQIVAEWHAMAYDEYAHHLRLKPGAKEYLSRLKSRGTRIALATGTGPDLYEPALRHNGVYGFFDAFVTLNDVTRGKSFPDIYLLAAEKLRLTPPQCMVFEDIYDGVRGAKAAGMNVVAVYDPFSFQDRQAIERLADRCIPDFSQLLAE